MRLRFKALGLMLALLPCAAAAQSPLEARVAELNPCQDLRHEERVLFATVVIAVDRLKDVRIGLLDVEVEGDLARISVPVGLTCATSESAVVTGDAALDLDISAELALSSCQTTDLRLENARMDGSFAEILRLAYDSVLKPVLDREIRGGLERACRVLMGQAAPE